MTELWSLENPALYIAETEVYTGGKVYTDWSGGHYKKYRTIREDGKVLRDRVQSGTEAGTIDVEVSAPGVRKSSVRIQVK